MPIRYACVVAAGLVLLVGCAPQVQHLEIRTDPAGAEVLIQLRGNEEAEAAIAGIYAKVKTATFEEDFVYIGRAPLDWELALEQGEGAIFVKDVAGGASRRYTEGTVRIELAGYESEERIVRFTGDTITLRFVLQPLQTERAG